MEESDAQLQMKKRARRRLVGAVAFVSFVALVLPMVMDQEPRQPVQDVEIRIPGQDEKPFAPKFAANPVERQPVAPAVEAAPAMPAPPAPEAEKPKAVEKATAQVLERTEKGGEKAPEKAAEKVAEKPAADKPAAKAEKAPEKVAEKADKTADKDKKAPAKDGAEAKRAAALLSGSHAAETPAPAAKSSDYLVLIGAFANEGNVKNLKTKLGEQGIKTFTEPLETPQGRKIRLRAGPFASREAAEKALEKMQRIGVSGVVAGK